MALRSPFPKPEAPTPRPAQPQAPQAAEGEAITSDARRDLEEVLRLEVRVGQGADDTRRRWWRIRQPPPSVAFTLRGRISSCLGGTMDWAVRNFLAVTDPQAEADLVADGMTVGEALALRTFYRARTGRAVVDAGEDVSEAAARLLAVASAVSAHAGVDLNAALLLGEHERERDNMAFRWAKPSLLHRLLLDSSLTYGGDGERPRYPSGRPGEQHAGAGLWKAVEGGSVGEFVRCLDQVVAGPDELTLLCAWALLHLWRPF